MMLKKALWVGLVMALVLSSAGSARVPVVGDRVSIVNQLSLSATQELRGYITDVEDAMIYLNCTSGMIINPNGRMNAINTSYPFNVGIGKETIARLSWI